MSNPTTARLPEGFLWGVAMAGHQNEGDSTASDIWFLEHTEPTIFREPSGPACRTWELWERDLDLAAGLGLTAFRFSVEWARVEPAPGEFSAEALDHYEAVVDGCLERGMAPIVTFSHFAAPHWFAVHGSWASEDAPELFARYCGVVAERFADRIALAVTLNEPNLVQMLISGNVLPPEAEEAKRAMLDAASRATGAERYRCANVFLEEELPEFQAALTEVHRAARAAIKAHRADLPVGLSIAVTDEYALPGGEAGRDRKRAEVYDHWLRLAREDDFVGVQNYERIAHGPDGPVPPEPGAAVNGMGTAVEPDSLAGAVAYAHRVAGVPVLVSEHGMSTEDDDLRADFIEPSLAGLAGEVERGVPVLGYCHWTLLDNYEWVAGYHSKLGLHSVDRQTFERRPKRSAGVYRDAVLRYREASADAAPRQQEAERTVPVVR
ncbi:glycoside hydrolase family 1 protein [Nocardiopsis sp. YSL2]|uniref:glycoside hydrolase family 1 protein n=1 Tax=Nocardiopsis sp. YSL2 TaxID=2939492 RepID=UPI0026F42577|nr:family 1 glycosylhydrolase [Nocardiopsis sp. YSL2]